MDNIPTWLTILISLGTLVFGAAGTWFISFYKEISRNRLDATTSANQHNIAESNQALLIYKEVVTTLQSDRITMQKEIDELSKEHLKCVENHGKLTSQIEFLTSELNEIKQQFYEYRSSHP